MPWEGDAYEGYIPLSALRERDPREIVTMEVRYGDAWLQWFEHGASVGSLIALLTTEPGVREGTRRRRLGSIADNFQGAALADRLSKSRYGGVRGAGLPNNPQAAQFRIVVIGEMGRPRGQTDWPKSR